MEWIIKITGEKNQRIRVEFNPLLGMVVLYGEYKMKNGQWEIFESIDNSYNLDIENLNNLIEEIIIKMRIKIDGCNKMIELFNEVKEIEFLED